MSKALLLAQIAVRSPQEFANRIEAIVDVRIVERYFTKRGKYTRQVTEEVLTAIADVFRRPVDLEGLQEIEDEVWNRMQVLERVAPFTTRHHADFSLGRLLGRPSVVIADDIEGNRAFSEWVEKAKPTYWAAVHEEGKEALAGVAIFL